MGAHALITRQGWSDRDLKVDIEPVTDTYAAENTDETPTPDSESAIAQAPVLR